MVLLVGFFEHAASDIASTLRSRGALAVPVANVRRAKVVVAALSVDVVLVGPAVALRDGFDLAASFRERWRRGGPAVLGVARALDDVYEDGSFVAAMSPQDLNTIVASIIDAISKRRSC